MLFYICIYFADFICEFEVVNLRTRLSRQKDPRVTGLIREALIITCRVLVIFYHVCYQFIDAFECAFIVISENLASTTWWVDSWIHMNIAKSWCGSYTDILGYTWNTCLRLSQCQRELLMSYPATRINTDCCINVFNKSLQLVTTRSWRVTN